MWLIGMMESLEQKLINVLASCDFKNKKEPFLYFVACLNSFLERHGIGRLIIVGGYAVELYSGGAYKTGDVDVIVEGDVDFVKSVLSKLSGKRGGRIWVLREIGLISKAIDIVSSLYDKEKNPVRVEVEDFTVYIEPPEETIISCLNACIYWKSDLDCEKAAMVMAAQWDRIDWSYLRARSEKENVAEILEKIKTIVGELRERG